MIRVSAVIPVYNGVATVGAAVRSALDQRFDGLEVIVVDDGSTDATVESLKSWGAAIKLVQQSNAGPAVARNRAARIATGKYLAFLDADDAWLPGKLGATVAALDSRPEAVLAYSNFVSIDGSGGEIEEKLIEPDSEHAPSMDEMLTRWWPILTSTVVMRRETFERCGGFSEAFKKAGYEDPYLWLIAREHGEFIYLPERLVSYRAETALDRMEKYKQGCAIFARLVRERYGARGARLAREVVGAQASALGYHGLLAMRRGDRRQARRAFTAAMRYEPWRLRNAMRWLRTFLPQALARRLTGRTRDDPRRGGGQVYQSRAGPTAGGR